MVGIRRYSVCLFPTGDIYERIHQIILKLSAEFGSPAFKPHVTLIPQLKLPYETIVEGLHKISKKIAPLKIDLGDVQFENTIFTSLYVRAKKTPELELASQLAKQTFNRDDDDPFRPHLSLLYGQFPESVKSNIISEIGAAFSVEFEVQEMSIVDSSGSYLDWTWEILENFPLDRNV